MWSCDGSTDLRRSVLLQQLPHVARARRQARHVRTRVQTLHVSQREPRQNRSAQEPTQEMDLGPSAHEYLTDPNRFERIS